jgi:legumain
MGPGKKTIKSGPNDRIFVYFADHGAPGLIAFPTTWLIIEHVLHAKDLISTLQTMYNNKQYKEMVFYIEACESGSMFNGLLKDEWNIYATTAANPYESSYACGWSDIYYTYLSDCYSVDFLVDTESSDLSQVTFEQQYQQLKQQVNTSHVCQYGTKSISNETLAFFLGVKSDEHFASPAVNYNKLEKMDSRSVTEDYLKKMVQAHPNDEYYQSKHKQYNKLALKADVVFGAFYHAFNLQQVSMKSDHCQGKSVNVDCTKTAITAMQKYCGNFSEASIKYAKYIRDACWIANAEEISLKFRDICSVATL